MAKVTVSESLNTVVPDNVYILRCTKYEVKPGQYGDFIDWHFKIMGTGNPEWDDAIINGRTPGKMSPGSQLYEWLKGFGVPETHLQPGMNYDLDNCVNVVVKAFVETTPDKKDPQKKYSNVTKIISPAQSMTMGGPNAGVQQNQGGINNQVPIQNQSPQQGYVNQPLVNNQPPGINVNQQPQQQNPNVTTGVQQQQNVNTLQSPPQQNPPVPNVDDWDKDL